jgi:chromosome segregation ATPase
MRNLVLIVAMVAAGLAGFFLGGWSGRDAKEALARVEASARESEAQYQKTTKDLQAKLAALGSEHEQATQKIKDDFKKQEDAFASAVKVRDQRIVDLQRSRQGIQAEIADAKARLAAAKTEADRLAAQADIGKLQKKEEVVVATVEGEQCANVKVPPSLLTALGVTP